MDNHVIIRALVQEAPETKISAPQRYLPMCIRIREEMEWMGEDVVLEEGGLFTPYDAMRLVEDALFAFWDRLDGALQAGYMNEPVHYLSFFDLIDCIDEQCTERSGILRQVIGKRMLQVYTNSLIDFSERAGDKKKPVTLPEGRLLKIIGDEIGKRFEDSASWISATHNLNVERVLVPLYVGVIDDLMNMANDERIEQKRQQILNAAVGYLEQAHNDGLLKTYGLRSCSEAVHYHLANEKNPLVMRVEIVMKQNGIKPLVLQPQP